VVPLTTYTPLPAPAEESTGDEEQPAPDQGATEQPATEAGPSPTQEDNMPGSTGAGGSAPTGPRQVIEAEMASLRRQVAQMAARERARDVVAETLADAWLTPAVVARISGEALADLPLVNDTLDEAALRNTTTAARDRAETEVAEALAAAGVGTPRGLGAQPGTVTGDAHRVEDRLVATFQGLGMSESAARLAAKGR
jgi:hypothetical protein